MVRFLTGLIDRCGEWLVFVKLICINFSHIKIKGVFCDLYFHDLHGNCGGWTSRRDIRQTQVWNLNTHAHAPQLVFGLNLQGTARPWNKRKTLRVSLRVVKSRQLCPLSGPVSESIYTVASAEQMSD